MTYLNTLHPSCSQRSQGFDSSHVLSLLPSFSRAIATSGECRNHVPVALLLPRGLNLAAAEFSVLHLGRFFLPIDPNNPADRIETILKDSSADIVVVDQTTKHLVSKLPAFNVVDLSELQVDTLDFLRPSDLDELITLQPNDLAYMIYTSGSAGQPKGVPVHWSALDNHNQWFINEFNLTADDRCTQIMSPGFDVSIQDIFPVLRSGASLYPAGKELLTDPFRFLQWVESNQLTVLSFPTALWHTLVPVLANHPWPQSVRLVLIGGEQVNPQLVKQWFSNVDSNAVRLVNMYGPTEATIASTFCDLSSQQPSAIGKPIDNVGVQLLDDHDNVVRQPDTIGEIVLSGAGVVNGYWKRAKQSDRSFFQSAKSGQRCYRTGDLARYDRQGQLLFAGRKDDQVKLRGFRIELNEIALAVCSHPKIADAIVRKTTATTGHQFLACFAVIDVAAHTNNAVMEQELRDYLQDTLPQYMIPTAFQFVGQLPVTIGGKVDTAKLLNTMEQSRSSDGLELYRTETERRIAKVWKAVFGHYPDSNSVTFDESGGDSLTAVSFVLKLQQEFDLTGVGVASLTVQNTVQRIAAYVDELAGKKTTGLHAPSVTHLPQTGDLKSRPCLILFHPVCGSGYFYNELVDQQLRENFSILIVESPFLTSEVPTGPAPSVAEIAQQYFPEVVQHLVDGQQVITAGFSFGALIAWEFAKLLERENFQVARVINIDQPVPSEIRRCSFRKRLYNWLLFRLKFPIVVLHDIEQLRKMNAVRLFGQKDKTDEVSRQRHLANLEDFYFTVERGYVPKNNGLELTLIRGDIFIAKLDLPERYGWSEVTDGLRVVHVSGSHSTLFHKCFIDQLRSAFVDALKP